MVNRIITALFFTSHILLAQDLKKAHVLKLAPLGLFEFDNTLSLSYEQTISAKKSWQAEVGYGNSDFNFLVGPVRTEFWNSDRDYRGFTNLRLRGEYRNYFKRNNALAPLGSYYSFEGVYKNVAKKMEIEIGRDFVGGLPTYNELVQARYQKQVYALHFKIGHQGSLFFVPKGEQPKWLFDIYCGGGFRYIKRQIRSGEENIIERITRFQSFGPIGSDFLNNTNSLYSPSIYGGFKIGKIL